MRENTKWIMLVTAGAFVALMVFEWGMDITGQTAGGIGEVGSVNGTPVMYDDYMATYRNLYNQVQDGQEEPITSQQDSEIEDAAFDDIVTQILITDELERRGIRVTDEEVRQAAMTSPHPAFQNDVLFQTDGQFDLQKYQQYLSSPQVDPNTLLALESYYRSVIPRGKLMRQVTSGVFFTDDELWSTWRADQETAEVRYLTLDPAQRISDDEVEVTDAELRAYYDEHEEDFEVPARAQVRALILDKTPTPADSAATRERAAELRERVEGEEDFAETARLESGDQTTAEAGGSMGVVGKDQLVPALDSVVFSTEAGAVAGPVRSPSGLHVVQVDERWGQDSASVRHILVSFARADDSEIELLTLADSVEDLTENRSFEEAAQLTGLEIDETEFTDAFPFLPGAGQVGEGSDWAFLDAAPGEVSPLFENGQAFYAIELVSRTPGGIESFEEVRDRVRQILVLERKVERARADAGELVARIRGGASLEEVAQEEGLEVHEEGPFTRNEFVPGLGQHNAAVGAAFGLGVGEVSDPVVADQRVFVVEKTAGTPADRDTWEVQKDLQRQLRLQQVEQQRVQEWIEALRANAEIIDRRAEVLQAAEEAQDQSTRPQPSLF